MTRKNTTLRLTIQISEKSKRIDGLLEHLLAQPKTRRVKVLRELIAKAWRREKRLRRIEKRKLCRTATASLRASMRDDTPDDLDDLLGSVSDFKKGHM